jgi:hypothetical protein
VTANEIRFSCDESPRRIEPAMDGLRIARKGVRKRTRPDGT